MLTDQEIIELEQLLRIESLEHLDEETTKNYMFLKKQYNDQAYEGETIISGSKGVILEVEGISKSVRLMVYSVLCTDYKSALSFRFVL